MARAITSQKRAKAIASAVFFIGLAIISFRFAWWPSIMLVIGLSLGIKQFLLGKIHDMLASLFVFFGVFISAQFNVEWEILLPVVFILSAIYILVREFSDSFTKTEIEKEEDLNHEIEEDQDKN